MRKVKTYKKIRSAGEKVLDVIAYYQSKLELSPKELAEKVAIPYATLWRRSKNPDAFTLGELVRISKTLDIPMYDLLTGNITA